MTRETEDVSIGCESCGYCFELAGLENEVADGCKAPGEAIPAMAGLILAAWKKGGNAKRLVDGVAWCGVNPELLEAEVARDMALAVLRGER
jgi:hypothetical protein